MENVVALPVGARSIGSTLEPASAELAESPPETARQFLARYYGSRWSETEAKIKSSGQDLDVPYHFTPWEQCAPEFAKIVPLDDAEFAATASANVLWPDALTIDWIRQHYTIGKRYTLEADDLRVIENLTAEQNSLLRSLGDEFATRLDQHLEDMWRRGTYLRAPFTTNGLSTQEGFHSESHAGYGWSVTLTLTREECPDVVEIEDQMVALRAERDERVARYLLTRTSH